MKKAFTLLELVIVIVVVSIIAVAVIPRTTSNHVHEGATKLISHIRYTQHLGMVDDKFNATIPWYKNLWQIQFNANKYSIVSDNNTSFAVDPLTKNTNIKDIDLNNDYQVTLAFSGGCAGITTISFDHLGRPLIGDLSTVTTPYPTGQLLQTTCSITLTDGSTSAIIDVEPETGYTHLR